MSESSAVVRKNIYMINKTYVYIRVVRRGAKKKLCTKAMQAHFRDDKAQRFKALCPDLGPARR